MRNVLLVPITVMTPTHDLHGHDGGKLRSSADLKVGQWEDAWLNTPNTLAGGFPDQDVDRFYIRIPNICPPDKLKVSLKTMNSVGITLDEPAAIPMTPVPGDPGAFTSESHLLVADLPDKNAVGAGKDADRLRKRLHRMNMYSRLEIAVQVADQTGKTTVRIPGFGRGKQVDVNAVIIRNTPGGAAPISEAEVQAELRGYVQSAFAQANVSVIGKVVTVDPPAGMDFTNGVEQPVPGSIPASVKQILDHLGTPSPDDICIFYVSSIKALDPANPRTGAKGFSIIDSAFPNSADKPYVYNCFIGKRDALTTSHELGHLLTNDGHIESVEGWESNSDLYRLQRNLMFGKVNVLVGAGVYQLERYVNGSIFDSKRLLNTQVKKIRNNPHIR